MSENRFAEAEDIPQLIYQLVGAASTCWIGGTGDKEFWTAEARKVAGEAITRLNELGCGCVPVFPKASQVPDSLRTRIAEVLGSHRELPGVANPRCRCGWMGTHKGHEGHQADAVIAELGLRQDRVQRLHRYVTEWVLDA